MNRAVTIDVALELVSLIMARVVEARQKKQEILTLPLDHLRLDRTAEDALREVEQETNPKLTS